MGQKRLWNPLKVRPSSETEIWGYLELASGEGSALPGYLLKAEAGHQPGAVSAGEGLSTLPFSPQSSHPGDGGAASGLQAQQVW